MPTNNALDAILEPHGFTWNKGRQAFVHVEEDRLQLFQFVETELNPATIYLGLVAAVRFERVEEIFHRISGVPPDLQSRTITAGVDLWRIYGDEYRRQAPSDWRARENECNRVAQAFLEQAIPYYSNFSSLTDLDREINAFPDKPCIHRVLPWLRCTTGIIAAKLAQRPDYNRLKEVYTDQMAKSNKGFYLPRFNKLLEVLGP